MHGWQPEDLADAIVEAASRNPAELHQAADWAATFTWDNTAAKTGAALEHLVTHRGR